MLSDSQGFMEKNLKKRLQKMWGESFVIDPYSYHRGLKKLL